MGKKIGKFIFTAGALTTLGALYYRQNYTIELTQNIYTSLRVPKSFDGYRIVHISDLHNRCFGKNQERLLNTVKQAKPDVILATGDLIERTEESIDNTLLFMQKASELAPIYFVTGNHEKRSNLSFQKLLNSLKDYNAHLIDGKKVRIARNNEEIMLYGIQDPYYFECLFGESEYIKSVITTLDDVMRKSENTQKSTFRILLAHRPELFALYTKYHYDLVLSGHTHGAWMRLPVVGGIFAPGQGFFPAYSQGFYKQHHTTMYVNRGLSMKPYLPRVLNRGEVALIELRHHIPKKEM